MRMTLENILELQCAYKNEGTVDCYKTWRVDTDRKRPKVLVFSAREVMARCRPMMTHGSPNG